MVDEIYDRAYQARREEMNADLSAGLRSLAGAMRNTFLVLNRIEYDAPWNRNGRTSRAN